MLKTLVCFDFDSTLSMGEGIDDLWVLAGKATEISTLTAQAMGDSKVRVEDVFALRLELIRPTREMVAQIAETTRWNIFPWMAALIKKISATRWHVVHIISGGHTNIILPTARDLGIPPGHVHAVELYFDEAGNYANFDRECPTTRSGGKIEIIQQLQLEHPNTQIFMVGDWKTDLETAPHVTQFMNFTGVIDRWLDLTRYANTLRVTTVQELEDTIFP